VCGWVPASTTSARCEVSGRWYSMSISTPGRPASTRSRASTGRLRPQDFRSAGLGRCPVRMSICSSSCSMSESGLAMATIFAGEVRSSVTNRTPRQHEWIRAGGGVS